MRNRVVTKTIALVLVFTFSFLNLATYSNASGLPSFSVSKLQSNARPQGASWDYSIINQLLSVRSEVRQSAINWNERLSQAKEAVELAAFSEGHHEAVNRMESALRIVKKKDESEISYLRRIKIEINAALEWFPARSGDAQKSIKTAYELLVTLQRDIERIINASNSGQLSGSENTFKRKEDKTFKRSPKKSDDSTRSEARNINPNQNININEFGRVSSTQSRAEARRGTQIKNTLANLIREHVVAVHLLMSIHAGMLFPTYIQKFVDQYLVPLGLVSENHVQIVPEMLHWEALFGILIAYVVGHTEIWWHERAHYWEAVRQIVLREDLLPAAREILTQSGLNQLGREFKAMLPSFLGGYSSQEKAELTKQEELIGFSNWSKRWFNRIAWEARMFALIPLGKFPGISRNGLSFQPESPFNLDVSAAGPRASGKMAVTALVAAFVLLPTAFLFHSYIAAFASIVALGLSAVGFLDWMFADPGSLQKLNERTKKEKAAQEKVATTQTAGEQWIDQMAAVKKQIKTRRIVKREFADGTVLQAPYGFRNSGMGGKHTEKQYPESNISLQEAMFIPLSAKSYEEAQEMTVTLQNKLQDIINSAEGARVMGIGLEGGLAPYITPSKKGEVPELRLWRMMKEAIEKSGYKPGVDVVLALDPAASELEEAYREHFDQPDAVGQYLFWRDGQNIVMNRDELLDLYLQAIDEGIPIISIEDGFSENDWEGFEKQMKVLGDKAFIVADDLATTNDAIVEEAADRKAANALLVKPNQIGTLTETVLANLTALGKGMDLISSHRSTKPNDTMEAHVALAFSTVGLKSGGGANTERLVVYKAVSALINSFTSYLNKLSKKTAGSTLTVSEPVIEDILVTQDFTNAGTPTIGITTIGEIPGSKVKIETVGAAPRGTSAGSREAVDLVNTIVERGPLTDKYPDLFTYNEKDEVFKFKKGIKLSDIEAKSDADLLKRWKQAEEYGGKGVSVAVETVKDVLIPRFSGLYASQLRSLLDIDREILRAEVDTAKARGKTIQNPIKIAQRKMNLGMNGTLAMSLALARFLAQSEGKELWQLLREQGMETMAKVIVKYKTDDAEWDFIKGKPGNWHAIYEDNTFENLVLGLQKVEAIEESKEDKRKPLHQILREALPVYDFTITNPSIKRSEVRQKSFYFPEDITFELRNILGEKAVLLAQFLKYMQNFHLKISTPGYFAIPENRARELIQERAQPFDSETLESFRVALEKIENGYQEKFGNKENPLFVSLRASPVTFSPGQFLTILNIGVNDETLPGLAKRLGSEELAKSVYVKLIRDFLVDVHGFSEEQISEEFGKIQLPTGESVQTDILNAHKAVYEKLVHQSFPQNGYTQIRMVMNAIYNGTPRYTTALSNQFRGGVIIERMVFGVGKNSFAGEVSSRNPETGMRKMIGNIEPGVQGDTTTGLNRFDAQFFKTYPELSAHIDHILNYSEQFLQNAARLEITIEKGKVYILQIRHAEQTAEGEAALIMDLMDRHILSEQKAYERAKNVDENALFERYKIGNKKTLKKIAKGILVSPGVGVGHPVISAAGVEKAKASGAPYILIKPEIRAHDKEAIEGSQGVISLDQVGNHAESLALKARVPAVLKVDYQSFDFDSGKITLISNGKEIVLDENDANQYVTIAIDGTIYLGKGNIITEYKRISPETTRFIQWKKGLDESESKTSKEKALHISEQAIQQAVSQVSGTTTNVEEFAFQLWENYRSLGKIEYGGTVPADVQFSNLDEADAEYIRLMFQKSPDMVIEAMFFDPSTMTTPHKPWRVAFKKQALTSVDDETKEQFFRRAIQKSMSLDYHTVNNFIFAQVLGVNIKHDPSFTEKFFSKLNSKERGWFLEALYELYEYRKLKQRTQDPDLPSPEDVKTFLAQLINQVNSDFTIQPGSKLEWDSSARDMKRVAFERPEVKESILKWVEQKPEARSETRIAAVNLSELNAADALPRKARTELKAIEEEILSAPLTVDANSGERLEEILSRNTNSVSQNFASSAVPVNTKSITFFMPGITEGASAVIHKIAGAASHTRPVVIMTANDQSPESRLIRTLVASLPRSEARNIQVIGLNNMNKIISYLVRNNFGVVYGIALNTNLDRGTSKRIADFLKREYGIESKISLFSSIEEVLGIFGLAKEWAIRQANRIATAIAA